MQRPEPRLIRTARDAERATADWLRYWGYVDAYPAGGGDGGVDVQSVAAVAQVNAEVRPIGRRVIQQTFGIATLEDKQAFVFSLAGFTPDAIKWASAAGVALFSFDLVGEPEPENAKAMEIATASEVSIELSGRLLWSDGQDVTALASMAAKGVSDRSRWACLVCAPVDQARVFVTELAQHTGAKAREESARLLSIRHRDLAAGIVTSLEENEMLVVLAVEDLAEELVSTLGQALETGAVDVILGDGSQAQEVRVELGPFSVVGVASEPGLIRRALRDRFDLWVVRPLGTG